MSAKVVPLRQLFRPSSGWSSSELGEFYRIEAVLIKAGLRVDTDSGISDEGDPWFAFCRGNDGEVIVHIARIGRVYFLASPSFEGFASGSNLRTLVCDLVNRHPLVQLPERNNGSNIFLHPAALLTAIVATAFFKSAEVRPANEAYRSEPRSGGTAGRSEIVASGGEIHKTVLIDAAHTAVILYAVTEALQNEGMISILSATDLLDLSAPILPKEAVDLDNSHSFNNTQLGPELANISTQMSEIPAESPVSEPAAEALPLISILWDLSKSPLETMVIEDKGFFSGRTSAEPASDFPVNSFISIILTIGLLQDSAPSLPTIKAVEINLIGANGGAETKDVSDPHKLSASLLKALEASTHNIVDTQFLNAAGQSFAISFIDSWRSADVSSQHADTSSDSAHHSTTDSVVGSSIVQDVPISAAPDVSDVQLIVQYFLQNVSDFIIFETGNNVVIYDTVAVASPSHDLTSVTFDFSDGSMLSLIGLAADLLHSHA